MINQPDLIDRFGNLNLNWSQDLVLYFRGGHCAEAWLNHKMRCDEK